MDRKLLYCFFRNQTTAEEEKRIMDWLDADVENQNLFDAEREVYNSMVIHAPGLMDTKRRKQRRMALGNAAKYVAGVAAMLIVAAGIGYLLNSGLKNEMTAQTQIIFVPAGQRINLTLSDGTSVWLNSETQIEYPALFGKERRVKVNGEALFDVKHDPAHPFIVETFACNVEVLGTKFNVAAESRTGRFETALLSGKLKVTHPASHDELTLQTDDVVKLVAGHLSLGKIDSQDNYRWPEGFISIGNMSFPELMAKFEKYYDVDIVIDRTDIPQNKYIGKIRISDGIEHAMRILQRTSNFVYVKDEANNTIYIR